MIVRPLWHICTLRGGGVVVVATVVVDVVVLGGSVVVGSGVVPVVVVPSGVVPVVVVPSGVVPVVVVPSGVVPVVVVPSGVVPIVVGNGVVDSVIPMSLRVARPIVESTIEPQDVTTGISTPAAKPLSARVIISPRGTPSIRGVGPGDVFSRSASPSCWSASKTTSLSTGAPSSRPTASAIWAT